jgi:hypothetical protein
MPLTIVDIHNNGLIHFEDEDGIIVGTGRAVASKSVPGYVTITFNHSVAQLIAKGNPIRVPINWMRANTLRKD